MQIDERKDYKFNAQEFNKYFEEEKQVSKAEVKKLEDERLSKLNNLKKEQLIFTLSLGQILINTKDAWFDLFDDILTLNVSWDTFTKNHRIFYIGVTMIMFCLFLYVYDIIIYPDNPDI